MRLVRIAIDETKNSSFIVQVNLENRWETRYAFTKKKKSQEIIDAFFKNCKQIEDFIVEKEA